MGVKSADRSVMGRSAGEVDHPAKIVVPLQALRAFCARHAWLNGNAITFAEAFHRTAGPHHDAGALVAQDIRTVYLQCPDLSVLPEMYVRSSIPSVRTSMQR